MGTIPIPPGLTTNWQRAIVGTTIQKLKLLHSVGVYHLDIKGPNMCYFSDTDIRFADWGLSCVSTTVLNNLSIGYDRLEPSFVAYYSNLCFSSRRLDTYLLSACTGVFDLVKDSLYEITMYYLSLYVNKEVPAIIDILMKNEGIDSKLATHLVTRLANKIEHYMLFIGEHDSQVLFEYASNHSLDETIVYAEQNYRYGEEIEQFIYYVFAKSLFDRNMWLDRIQNANQQVLKAFRTIDFCCLGSAFIRITDRSIHHLIEQDMISRVF